MTIELRCHWCSEHKAIECEPNLIRDRITDVTLAGWYADYNPKLNFITVWCSPRCETMYRRQKRTHLKVVGMVHR